MKSKIALVDMDGTLADYQGALTAEMEKLQGPEEQPYLFYGEREPHIAAREALVKCQAGFWRSLPQIQLGFDIVEDLRTIGYGLHILTKGPRTTVSAWTEKVEWCKVNIPDADITVTHDKSLVYGRVLIDDFPPYFLGWLATRPRGLVICVAQECNKEFGKDKNIIRYDGTNREQVREALKAAFDREAGSDW